MGSESDMTRQYIDLIKFAIVGVAPEYFNLKTTYEPSGIVRERVFCYELYHQMRLLMESGSPISLNGEIDKRGHIDFQEKDRKNPDFVFHIPGEHEGNTLVVEVKGRLDDKKGILKDFETLHTFVGKYHYQAGIFILYNHSFTELLAVCGEELWSMRKKSGADSIYILSLASAGGTLEENKLDSVT